LPGWPEEESNTRPMSSPDAKNFSAAIPVVVVLMTITPAGGVAPMVATAAAAVATIAAAYLAAQFVWSPLFVRAGFVRTSLLLVGALMALGLAAAVAGRYFRRDDWMGVLVLRSAILGLLLSWTLAAIWGAQAKREAASSLAPTEARSRLWRGRRRAHS
jgi:hypothetical protein